MPAWEAAPHSPLTLNAKAGSPNLGVLTVWNKRLSIHNPPSGNNQDQKENQPQQAPTVGDGLNPRPLSWCTLSVGPTNKLGHKRTLSLSHKGLAPHLLPYSKRSQNGRVGMRLCLGWAFAWRRGLEVGAEGCPSLLSSPCSEKTFDFKAVRRMSTAFSECSYPETEEDEHVSESRSSCKIPEEGFDDRVLWDFLSAQSRHARRPQPCSAALKKLNKLLKESPSSSPPQYLNNCYGLDKSRHKSFTISGTEDLDSTCGSKRSSICSVATEPEASPGSERLSKLKQRFSISSTRSESPELPSAQDSPGITVNPFAQTQTNIWVWCQPQPQRLVAR